LITIVKQLIGWNTASSIRSWLNCQSKITEVHEMTKDDLHSLANQAWEFFRRGDFARAEQATMAVVNKAGWAISTPWPDLLILRAFHCLRLGAYDHALSLFGGVLEKFPDDACAQEGFLLALQGQLQGSNHIPTQAGSGGNATHSETGILILGLGTGRCGSTSISKLLENQDDCYCYHEHPPRLTWEINPSRWNFHKRRLDILLNHYRFVGDISHWWLPYIDLILEHYENVRVVVLKREKAATIKSFLKIKKIAATGRMLNHWVNHDGTYWIKTPWDECYPSYDVSSVEEALNLYWEQYYDTVDKLTRRAPSSVRTFPTEHLSDKATQLEILSFCGFKNPKTLDDMHLNKEKIKDGESNYLRRQN
jgi:hypothetical protein